MTILSAIAAMLGTTARDWNLSGNIHQSPVLRAQAGSVKSHQRRAKRLKHF